MKSMKNMQSENSLTTASQPNNKDYSKNTELIKQTPIDETIFTMVEIEEKGAFIAIGNHRLTEFYQDKYKAYTDNIEHVNWEFLMNVISLSIETIVNDKLNKKQNG